MSEVRLAERLKSCGPTLNGAAAPIVLEQVGEAAEADGWTATLDAARDALTPIFAASPYLAGLARRWPERMRRTLETTPEARLADVLAETAVLSGGPDAVRAPLRLLKADLHLLTALCDLGGVWGLDQVTDALSRFADASVHAALQAVALAAREAGRLTAAPGAHGPIPGLFCLAMGKHGAGELNYSSDIDISFFHEPDQLAAALASAQEVQAFADRTAGAVARLLSERTGEGYVFRVDLRLRPDPSSTPPVVPAPAALNYYETVGQNWERAAFIKARPLAGDLPEAKAFLAELQPFIWRRSLDFGAIADVHSIKRQIHVHKADERLDPAGANLKLGRGGIREIEFYVQTQQLILGGRDRRLRSSRTLEALGALTSAGHVTPGTRDALTEAYVRLRGLEHRVQMLDDEQTHILPEDPDRRAAVSALEGEGDLAAFDRGVEALLTGVNAHYGELFPSDEQLSSDYGSLVFTGVENDPETLHTLERMGFSDPGAVANRIRGWHHGRIAPTRSARGREVFTRLAPRLLETCAETGAADAAFTRFALFFERLRAGVQVQSLFLAQPGLFRQLVETLAYSPRLAEVLARQSAALDAVMDGGFHAPLGDDTGVAELIVREAQDAPDFEEAMNRVRRTHREQAFRIAFQVLSGRADIPVAIAGFSDLAEACVRGLAVAARQEVTRSAGAMEGAVAVVALGKLGSREMSAGSDLDLMTVYRAAPDAQSETKGWSADVWYGRFTQRLIAALSAHTAEGGLYEVDMRLRPSGTAGPVAVSARAFEDYYAREADTWEFLALTRARVVWTDDPAFVAEVEALIETALRRPRDAEVVRHDGAAMRRLMARERPAWGFWDVKRSSGGLIDCEFAAQALQIVHAPNGGPLRQGTEEALRALVEAGLADATTVDPLIEAWRLQTALSQMLRAALERRTSPEDEPAGFQTRLAELGGQADLAGLRDTLTRLRAAARAAHETVLPPPATD